MLFGLISKHDLGTRVRGRAGSDLNGVIMFSLLIPLVAFFAVLVLSGAASIGEMLGLFVVFLVAAPLVYWSAHKDRREAEPLVRFLRDAVTSSGRTLRADSADAKIVKPFTLNIGGKISEGAVTPDAIHDALLGVGAGDFVILEADPETYIQTAARDGGYVLEMRKGDNQRHFQAVRRSSMRTRVYSDWIFTFEEVREAFIAYSTEAPMPHYLIWERMHLGK